MADDQKNTSPPMRLPLAGRCCVFQPFDKGAHDKRYDEIIAPAIRATGLEPYRVDRDTNAVIPVETLHEEIRLAMVCLADITTRNPNVMYELGYALAIQKNVVIICSISRSETFPLNIQHRGILQYASDSVSDFEKLGHEITSRIAAQLDKQATTERIASASPLKASHGLQPHEIAALAFVMSNSDGFSGVEGYRVRDDMEKAGYTRTACRLALIRLTRGAFIEEYRDHDFNGNECAHYRLTDVGKDWLLENQGQLQLYDSDSPF